MNSNKRYQEIFGTDAGQTPFSLEEREGLKIRSISTRMELDQFEQMNIEKAIEWSVRNKFSIEKFFSEKFILSTHNKMFGDVWKWAGQYRKTDKNIGVYKYQISVSLKNLLEDCKFWIENKTYSEDEIAIRFKHRLVSIHLFPNGNGRHSRLIADILVNKILHKEVFSWGSSIFDPLKMRTEYFQALQMADYHDYTKLIEFARS